MKFCPVEPHESSTARNGAIRAMSDCAAGRRANPVLLAFAQRETEHVKSMFPNGLKRLLQAALAVLALGGATPATPQPYPNRPINFIILFPPGGGLDHTARAILPKLAAVPGQSIVIENKSGIAKAASIKIQ